MSKIFDLENRIPVESAADFEKYPNYVTGIDGISVKPKEIIEPYFIKEWAPCGLKGAHRHQRGFMVLNDDGTTTNCGKDCGKRHLGEEWDLLTRAFSTKRKRETQLRNLAAFQAAIPNIKEQIKEVREAPFGAIWLHKALQKFNTEFPNELRVAMRSRAQRNEREVFEDRTLSPTEIDQRAEMRGISREKVERYDRLKVGQIAGLQVFANDIRELLVENIERPLTEIASVRVFDSLPSKKLRELNDFGQQFQRLFNSAKDLVIAGQKFFDGSNLTLFSKIVSNSNERRQLLRAKWSAETHLYFCPAEHK